MEYCYAFDTSILGTEICFNLGLLNKILFEVFYQFFNRVCCSRRAEEKLCSHPATRPASGPHWFQ